MRQAEDRDADPLTTAAAREQPVAGPDSPDAAVAAAGPGNAALSRLYTDAGGSASGDRGALGPGVLNLNAGNAALARLLGTSAGSEAAPSVPVPTPAPLPATSVAPMPQPAATAAPPAAAPAGSPVTGAGVQAPPAAAGPALALPAAPTPHQQDAIARLAALHAAEVARFDQGVDAGVTAIDAAVREQQTATDAALTEAVTTVGAGAAAARTGVQDAASAQDAQVTAAAEEHRTGLAAWQQGAVTTAAGVVQDRQAQAVAAGQQRAAQARDAAAATVARAQAGADGQVAVAQEIGAAKAAGVTETDQSVRDAQTAVARNLSGDAVTKISQGAQDAAAGMRGQGEEVAGALESMGTQLSADLGGHLDPVASVLGEDAGRGATAIDQTTAQGRGALAQQRDDTVAAIDGTETEAVGALQRDAGNASAALVEQGQQAADDLRRGADAATAELTAQVNGLVAQFAAAPADEAAAGEFGDAASQELSATVDQLDAGVRNRAGDLAGGLAGMRSQVAEAFTTTTGTATSGLDQQADGGGAALGQIGGGARDTMAAAADATRASGDATVTQFGDVLDAHLGTALPGLDELLGQHQGSLEDQVAELGTATASVTNSLTANIDAGQARAAERAKRSWLSNQFHDLWDSITSPEFLVGLLVGLAVAAIIIVSAGTATPFVIVAAGVAAGAAAGAAGTLTKNIRDPDKHGWQVFDGVLDSALIGGLVGGVGAAAFVFGTAFLGGLGLAGSVVGGFAVLELSAVVANTIGNLLTGQPWDKNLLTALLLAPLLARLAKFIPGLKTGEPPPEGGEPPLNIDPTAAQVGEWTFKPSEVTTEPDGTRVATIDAELSGHRGFGHATRGYNPQTGEFKAIQIDLNQVPKEARVVQVDGQPVPLSEYLTMRLMRMLEVPVAELRTVRVVEVEHLRSVLELEQQVRSGVPADEAARDLPVVRYNQAALGKAGGGQAIRAHVEGGQRMPLADLLAKWEGEAPDPAMVVDHDATLRKFGLTRGTAATYEVRSGFDVEVTIEPPGQGTPGQQPFVPVPRSDDHDDD